MGKSKFQAKAQETLIKKSTNPSGRAKYYDEDLPKKNSNNAFFAIFLIVMVLGAGGLIVNSIYQKNQEARDLLRPIYAYSYTDTSTQSTQTTTNGIKLGDTVKLEYTLYIAVPGSGVDGDVKDTVPYQGPSTFTTDVTPNDLIYGFYYNVLGMTEGQTKSFFLEANIDGNGDGYDDITGNKVVSYTSGDLSNTNLKFVVTIIDIQ